MPKKKDPILIDMPNGCIEWGLGRDRDGYGIRRFQGKHHKAHRVAFFEAHGYWPNVCRHTCDNPPCVNLKHLLDGTHEDNQRDKLERGRAPRGERSNTARLTEDLVKDIRRLYESGQYSWPELAKEFNMSLYATWAAGTGRTWRHVA